MSGLVQPWKRCISAPNGAAKLTASTFGVLAGLGGFVHGVGEVLQGSVRPDGLVVSSWTQGPIAAHMGGEPGMTLIPNMLATGIACMLVSIALIVVSVSLFRLRHGGAAVTVLSVAMLITGGGFGPPLLGVLAGAAGMRADRRVRDVVPRGTGGLRSMLAKAWPALYAITLASGTFLVVGSVVLVYGIGLHAPDFFVNNFLFTVVMLTLTVWAAGARQSLPAQAKERTDGAEVFA